jgi:hypothetical protein
MSNIPNRDITGNCDEGECRNTVREAEEKNQKELETSGVESPDSYPNAPGAGSRNEAPGWLGGHV